jgi:hypothetical protein
MVVIAPAGWALRFVLRQIIKRSSFPSPQREVFLKRLKDRKLNLLEYDLILDTFEAWAFLRKGGEDSDEYLRR